MELDRRNRRTVKRYGLELPFDYRLFGRDQSVQEGHGRTLNMSSRGLLVAADSRISKGQPIELSVQLPSLCPSARGAQLLILGQVLRTGPTGAAIKIVRHGFIRIRELEVAATETSAGV